MAGDNKARQVPIPAEIADITPAFLAAANEAGIEKSQDDIAYFRTIPWCAQLIDSPDLEHVLDMSRVSKNGAWDTFPADVLSRENIMPRWTTLLRRTDKFPKSSMEAVEPLDGERGIVTIPPRPPSQPQPHQDGRTIEQIHCLVQLGWLLNGWHGVAHGGVTSLLLDQVPGNLLRLRGALDRDPDLAKTGSVTLSLNVTFLGKVPAPGIVLVTSTLKERQRRRYFLETTIEAGDCVVLAKAECVFLAVSGAHNL